MLNEPGTSLSRPLVPLPAIETTAVPRETSQQRDLRELVASVLAIETERFEPTDEEQSGLLLMVHPESRLVATFEGRLLLDSEAAYTQLDALCQSQDYLPLFREERVEQAATAQTGLGMGTQPGSSKHVVMIVKGRFNPKPRPWWPNLLLFLGTLFSVLLVGMYQGISEIANTNQAAGEALVNNGLVEIWRGLPYALAIMLILGAHELGHYFAARRHNLAVTLPYFIPFPPPLSLFGTLGAFIQLRQPMRNRKMLLDVGAAGPLLGLVFAIPILFIGLATSPVMDISQETQLFFEGNSLLYAFAKFVVKGQFLPTATADVMVNQIAWAGWTGLLVTALNLLPLGQLDGGHVLYSIIGDRARRLYLPLIVTVFGLAVFVSEAWFFMAILLLLFGQVYAAPLDNITALDKRRRGLAIFTLVVFVLIFTPVPFTVVDRSLPDALPPGTVQQVPQLVLLGVGAALVWLRRRRV